MQDKTTNEAKNTYELFPFDELTYEQLAALMMEEIQIDGDRDFIDACRKNLIHRKPANLPHKERNYE